MEHIFYLNGDAKKISWVILTGDSKVEQTRTHVKEYFDKVSNKQSKYIALHVGLFWGVGTFLIKNQDTVMIKIDDKEIYEHLSHNRKTFDEFIENRWHFIKLLITQRKLKIRFEQISKKENLA